MQVAGKRLSFAVRRLAEFTVVPEPESLQRGPLAIELAHLPLTSPLCC